MAGRSRPDVGKYNAGQKLVFWSQAVLVATLFITGLGLWEAGLAYVEGLFGFKATIDQLRLAALIHAGAAVVAITIWIIHVYAAIWVRGTLSAMTRGFVTGGWGWRHHRKWLRKEVEKGDVERPRLRLRSNPRPIESDPRFEVLMSEVDGPKRGLMNIGEEAKPPFAVLPDPLSLFQTRSKRFDVLAPKHKLEPYLRFLAHVTRAQHDIQSSLPAAVLPSSAPIGQALELLADDVATLDLDMLLTEEGWKRGGQNPFLMGY